MAKASKDELSHPEFWDTRYNSEKDGEAAQHYEWFRTFENLRPFLEISLPAVETEPRILHLGCGLSTLPRDLHQIGYKNQCSIDFSEVAIKAMKDKYEEFHSLEWLVMDVRKMDFEDETFDCAIDKGTLDAMLYGSLWDPDPDVKKNVAAYVNEVARILKTGGRWLYITYRQPHFIRPLLTRPEVWSLNLKPLQDGPGSFEYFAWTMEKNSK